MNCEEIRERIDQMSPDDLKDPADEIMQSHLAACEGCREYRDKSISLIRALDCWEIPEPRKNIQAGVMAGIARLEREKSHALAPGAFWQQMASLFRYRFQVPAMAAASLILLLGISVIINIIQLGQSPRPGKDAVLSVDSGGHEGGIRTVNRLPTPPGEDRTGSVVVYEPDGKRLFDLGSGTLSVPVIVILGAPPGLPLEPEAGRRLERANPISRPGEDKI